MYYSLQKGRWLNPSGLESTWAYARSIPGLTEKLIQPFRSDWFRSGSRTERFGSAETTASTSPVLGPELFNPRPSVSKPHGGFSDLGAVKSRPKLLIRPRLYWPADSGLTVTPSNKRGTVQPRYTKVS